MDEQDKDLQPPLSPEEAPEDELLPDTDFPEEEEQRPRLSPDELRDLTLRVVAGMGAELEVEHARFQRLGEIGHGGVGIVWNARDEALGRDIAVKTLQESKRENIEYIERMVQEARATSQLQHPNIVPVYSFGIDHDVGIYYSMKKLKGESLRDVLRQLFYGNPEYLQNYPLSRLLAIYLKVCQGIAYAHSKGVIHRDLKPDNILIGEFGEVTIIDWGLVKKITARRQASQDDISLSSQKDAPADNAAALEHDSDSLDGTPRYMSPEQIVGMNSDLDARCDIYSLGVMLYEILTLRNPFAEMKEEVQILQAVTDGDFLPPRKVAQDVNDIPADLEAICLKAMSLNRDKRYGTVQELLTDMYNQASGQKVSAYKPDIFGKIARLGKRNPLRTAAIIGMLIAFLATFLTSFIIAEYSYWQTLKEVHIQMDKIAASHADLARLQAQYLYFGKESEEGRLQETRASLEAKISMQLSELISTYDVVYHYLGNLPSMVRNNQKVLRLYELLFHNCLEFSVANGFYPTAGHFLKLARAQYGDDYRLCQTEMQMFLKHQEQLVRGDCRLSVTADPPDAEIDVYPLTISDDGNRIIKSPQPAHRNSRQGSWILPKGSYMIVLTHPERREVLYNLFLPHGTFQRLELTMPMDIPEGMVYIPGGQCLLGGPLANNRPLQTTEIDGFFIREKEVTVAEYLEFWKTLSIYEREAHMSYTCLPYDGTLAPSWDNTGKLRKDIHATDPVTGIEQPSAAAYCQWLSARTGKNFRLPTADEWEKAARGADGRLYPWGNHLVPSFANINSSQALESRGAHLWAPPGSFPEDCSVYGVYDMAGNVREWTATPWDETKRYIFQIKGGSALTAEHYLPLERCDRIPLTPPDVGFRYVMSEDD